MPSTTGASSTASSIPTWPTACAVRAARLHAAGIELGARHRCRTNTPGGRPSTTTRRSAVAGPGPPRGLSTLVGAVFRADRQLVPRYGEAESARWWFETWNEPTWPGVLEGARRERVLQAARLRGRAACGAHCRRRASVGDMRPVTAARSRRGFLDHITAGTQLRHRRDRNADRLSSRSTPRARPSFVDGHVRMGIKDATRRPSTQAFA